jgi:hypothetical protein
VFGATACGTKACAVNHHPGHSLAPTNRLESIPKPGHSQRTWFEPIQRNLPHDQLFSPPFSLGMDRQSALWSFYLPAYEIIRFLKTPRFSCAICAPTFSVLLQPLLISSYTLFRIP